MFEDQKTLFQGNCNLHEKWKSITVILFSSIDVETSSAELDYELEKHKLEILNLKQWVIQSKQFSSEQKNIKKIIFPIL